MKKVFTSILLLAALSVPAYLSASALLAGDEGETEVTPDEGEGEEGGEGEAYVPEFSYQKYLIQNVGAGLYWSAGNNWGTQASLVQNPEFVKLEPQEAENVYHLESQVNNGGTSYYFNGSYMDNGSPVDLTVTKLENGHYTIAAADGGLYGYDGTTTVLAANATGENAEWTIVSLDDAKAGLSDATVEAPINATFLIDDANFGRNNRYSNKWVISEDCTNSTISGGNYNTYSNNCAESYHSTFTISQTVEAPNGVYAVTAQGFYRQDGEDNENLAVFFANEASQTFPLKTGAENSMTDAAASFTNGLYTIDPIYVEVTDGQLQVGVKNEANASLWCIWDNFTITYYGAEASIDEVRFAGLIAQVDELVAKAEGLKAEQYITEAASSELGEAITAASAEKETEEDYTAAIAKLQEAIANAEQAIKDNTIVQTGIVPDNDLEHWTCSNANTFHINTWSVEGNSDGSEMKTPFIENWVAAPGPLAEGAITYTVPGTFEAGKIAEVSALVRVYSESGAEVSGASFFVNDESVDVAEAGTAFEYNNMKGTWANIKVRTLIGEDGTLKFGVNIAAPTFNWVAIKNVRFSVADEETLNYNAALAALEDGGTYRVFTTAGEKKFYLNTAGYLVADVKKAATFTFNAVNAAGTLYETGWNLGCKFTNPSLTNGASGDVVQNGHINVGGNDRNDWERQVFFQNEEGKFAVRSTNANSANWGANTYWTVTDADAELPKADYSLDMSYVWEIEANVDNRPAAFAKVQTWASKLQAVEGLVQDAANWTTNAQESSEGAIANLIDLNTATFFHSQWSGTGPDEDHYIEATLPEATQEFYIAFIKRNDSNRPTQIDVTGGESETVTITEGLPAAGWYAAKVSLTAPASVVRFTVPTTSTGGANNGHQYFTFGEFYILPADGLTAEAAKYLSVADYTDLDDADVEPINEIAQKIDAAKAQIDLAADLAALSEQIAAVKAFVNENEALEGAEAVATANAAIAEVEGATYTTAEEIAAANAKLTEIAKAFIAAATVKKDIDVTEWYIVNPGAQANNALADGWEGTSFGSASDGVSEYWNKAAAEFHQTINLPAGDYKLSVVALQRTDMTGYVYAGETQTTIAQVASDVANSRAQAAAWFAAGNGVNEVRFSLAEAGDVTIGLQADADNGDHWTVWQGFKLELLAAGEVQEDVLELALNVDRYPGMAYTVTEATVGLAEAQAFLGVDELTTDMLTFVNPDGSEIDYATYTTINYDGWCNAEGVATTWGENTAICVKFFQAIPDGAYEICDMNGADEVGKTYSVKWALSANGKKVVYTINVTFVEKPAPVINNLAEVKVADTQTVALTSELGKSYEGLSASVDIDAIVAKLGVESVSDLAIFAVASDGALDDNYKLGTTDGWRNADGDWQGWGENARFCVKVDFAAEADQIQYVGGMDGQNTTAEWENPASYKARFVFVNLKSEDLDAVVLEVTLTYTVPDGINSIAADGNATIFDLNGRKVSKVQRGGIYIINGKKAAVK